MDKVVTITDAQLIKMYLNGKDQAFEKLYKRYEKPLYGFIFKFVGNRAITDDLFQQTWFKIIKALPHYQERGRFSSWMFGIANNCCIDHVRRKDVALKDNSAGSEKMETLPNEGIAPDTQMINDEKKAWLAQSISKLPADQRQVVLLRLHAEMPFKQIAEQLHCSLNTVLGRMHYAVKNLRKMSQEV